MDISLLTTLVTLAQEGDAAEMEWPTAVVAASAIIGGCVLITAIAVVALWQGLGTWRARMSIAREKAYRDIAEQVASDQQKTLEELERIGADLSDLRTRTAELERMLKEI